MSDDLPTSRQLLASVAIPLAESLLVTGVILNIFLRTPWRGSLTWKHLFLSAFLYMVVALLLHTLAVRLACKLFAIHAGLTPKVLTLGLWMSVAWVPLLVLLLKQQSILAIAVPAVILINAALFLRRLTAAAAERSATPPPISNRPTLLQAIEPPSMLSSLLPTACAALALQLAMVGLLFDRLLLAGSLFAIAIALPIWLNPARPVSSDGLPSSQGQGQPPSQPYFQLRSLATGSLIAFLLTALALLPFVAGMKGPPSFMSPLGARGVRAATSIPVPRDPGGGDYSGVVLVLPPKPHPKIVPPTPRDPSSLMGFQKQPIVIPFDGVYWYFKHPDLRPRPDAPIIRRDPTQAKIYSANSHALSMEAHQSLGTPIRLDCCSSIRVAIHNADNRAGTISIQIVFSNSRVAASQTSAANQSSSRTLAEPTARKRSPAQMPVDQPPANPPPANLVLGSMVLHSSELRPIALNRPPVDEVLTFPIPRSAPGATFDEITVVIVPAWERSLAGSQVAVQQFTLLP